VLLVWTYYSAQILFFGAEFTQVYANRRGSRIAPSRNAERVGERSRIDQGIPHTERRRVSRSTRTGRTSPR
jgi:membrane protein